MRPLFLLCLLTLLLAACTSPLTPSPTPTATPLAMTPTVTATALSQQPCTPPDETVRRYDARSFCLLAPSEVIRQDDGTGDAVLLAQPFQPDQPEAVVTFLIQSHPANGRTLDAAVAEMLAPYPAELTAQVVQTSLTLGGYPAVALDGLPGQTMNRQAAVIAGDTLYTLLLMPYGPSVPAAQPIAESLWQSVAASLTFVAAP